MDCGFPSLLNALFEFHRGSTVEDKTSKNLFMHIGNRFSNNPYECIAYEPTSKNSPRKKEWVICRFTCNEARRSMEDEISFPETVSFTLSFNGGI